MTVLWQIQKDAEFQGATVIFPSGETYPVASDHPKFADITAHLLGGVNDDSKLLDLINPFDAVFRNLYNLSDRVSRKGMKLFFDGDIINNSIAQYIIKAIDADGLKNKNTWGAYVNLLEKLRQNPSLESQEHLFHYIDSHGITIHPDGSILLYKGTNSDGTSTQRGYGVVTDSKGKTTVYESDYLPNELGSVVSIPRSMVDTNRGKHCSVGLHAGTYAYAKAHAPRLLTVKINPRDVVSVPNDYNNAKVRVARYEILEVNKGEYTSPVLTTKDLNNLSKVAAKVADKPKAAAKVKAAATPVAAVPATKVDEFKALILDLQKQGVNPKSYGSKKITAARRTQWKQALKELGIS